MESYLINGRKKLKETVGKMENDSYFLISLQLGGLILFFHTVIFILTFL